MKLARTLHTVIEKIGCRLSKINVSKLNLLNSSRSKVQRKKWMINGMRLVRPKHGHKQMLNFQKLFEGSIFNFVFRRLSIGRQIAGAVLSVIVCYIGISAYSYYQLTQIDNNYNDLLNKSAKMVSAAKGAAWYVSQSSSAMRGYLLTQDQGLLTLYPVYSAQVDNSVELMQKSASDPETKKYVKQIEDSKNAYSATVYAIQRYQMENNKDAFHAELKKSTEAIDKAIEAAEALVKVEEERLRKKSFENSEMTNKIKSQLIWVNIFTLILGLGLAFIISRKISRPISAIASTAAQIAEGNLLVRDISYTSSCEVGALGRSTNQMLSGLRSIILRISGGADHVKEASEMLSATATQMNTATARVATTIHEVASGAEQQLKVVEKAVVETDAILSGVERINMNVQTVAVMSETAALTAQQGRQTIEHTVAYLDEVSHKVKDTTQQTIGLTEASKKISGIINMITSIAGQTNLLALNAAIEAARAGDAGRGFAVVADEVRKLAEQSRASAQSIGQIVREIERQIESISYEMATRNQELSDGVSQASNAGQAFREITGHVEQLTAEIQSIRQTAAALSQNGSEVRKSMTQIEETARTNSMGAVEISAASEEQTAAIEEMTDSTHKLAALSSDLQKVVYQFKY